MTEHHVSVGVEVKKAETGRPCCLDEVVCVPASVEISSADPARNRFEKHVPGKDRKLTDVVDFDRPVSEDGGSHAGGRT